MICKNCGADNPDGYLYCQNCGATLGEDTFGAATRQGGKKRLYRSRTNKMLGGVCGGIAEYFDIDPTLVRLVFAFGTLFTALAGGVIAYILCLLIIPGNPQG